MRLPPITKMDWKVPMCIYAFRFHSHLNISYTQAHARTIRYIVLCLMWNSCLCCTRVCARHKFWGIEEWFFRGVLLLLLLCIRYNTHVCKTMQFTFMAYIHIIVCSSSSSSTNSNMFRILAVKCFGRWFFSHSDLIFPRSFPFSLTYFLCLLALLFLELHFRYIGQRNRTGILLSNVRYLGV